MYVIYICAIQAFMVITFFTFIFSSSSFFFSEKMSLIYSKFVKDVYIVTEYFDFK